MSPSQEDIIRAVLHRLVMDLSPDDGQISLGAMTVDVGLNNPLIIQEDDGFLTITALPEEVHIGVDEPDHLTTDTRNDTQTSEFIERLREYQSKPITLGPDPGKVTYKAVQSESPVKYWSLDDFRVHGRAMSYNEIRQHYQDAFNALGKKVTTELLSDKPTEE